MLAGLNFCDNVGCENPTILRDGDGRSGERGHLEGTDQVIPFPQLAGNN